MALQNMYDGFEDEFDDEQQQAQQAAAAPGATVSTSPSTVGAFDPNRVPKKTASGADIPVEWAQDFITRNPNDYHRIGEAYESDVKNKSVTQEWNSAPQSQPSSWYAPWFEAFRNEQQANSQQAKARGDALYDKLMQRIEKGASVNADDPTIRAQSGAFKVAQERAMDKYLQTLAEREGPYANLRGEQRRAAETTASNTSAYEAQLLAKDLERQYQDIQFQLSGALGLVSAEQARALQEKAMVLEQMAVEAGIDLQGKSLDMGWQRALMDNDLGLRNLGLQEWDRGMYYDLLQQGAFD